MSDYFSRALRAGPNDNGEDVPPSASGSAGGDYFSRALRGTQLTAEPAANTSATGTSIDFDRPVGEVRAAIAKLPESQREAARQQWAERYVAQERQGGGVIQTAGDMVRNFSRGTPVGSWLDEANAATADVLHRASGGHAGALYDEAVAYQRATDRAVDRDSTKVGRISVPFVGGVDVTGGDLTKIAGGVASMPVAPVINAFRGTTMLPQVANAALTGIGYGGVYGAGQGEGSDRLWEAGKGMAIGGAIAPAAVPLAHGVAHGVTSLANRFTPRPAAVRGYERGAVDRVARAVTDDELAPQYAQRVSELGPEGMLADMGPNLQAQTSAIANSPGGGMTRVTRALQDRREGAAGRIRSDVDQALGPAANIPETIHATQQHYRQVARPHRQQFQHSPVPFTPALEDTLNLLTYEPRVLAVAERYAAIDPAAGPRQFFARQVGNGQYEVTRVPNATEWDYIKRALDGLAQRPDLNDQRIYGALAARVRTQVDDAISPGAPQDSAWARARALESEEFQIRDAVDQGRSAFNRDITPDQMRAEMYGVGQPPAGGMSAAQLDGYRLGARDQVRTIMGTAATSHGENAAAAARSRLGSDYAREKLDLVAGPQAASQLTRRLDAESVFDQTRQNVLQNSRTALRQSAQQEFPGPTSKADMARNVGQRSGTGVVLEAGARLLNALTNGALNERRIRIARDAAEMLIAQGQARDNVANALFAVSQHQQFSRNARRAIARLAMQIAEGTRQKTIEASGPEPLPLPMSPAPSGRNARMSLPPPNYLLPAPR
jgi:hypothetical protein